MGTKRQLATLIGDVIATCKPGIFLDVFCGMGAVASIIASKRQVWTNDVQHFSYECSQAHFCSRSEPPTRLDTAALISELYSIHTETHLSMASSRLREENQFICGKDAVGLANLYDAWTMDKRSDVQVSRDDKRATLFHDTFAGSYFGLSQCIEIDAIRHAIDQIEIQGRIDHDQHRWLVLALCVAVSKCSTSTGHFAQPVRVKASNLRWFIAQRRRSIRETFMSAVEQLQAVGSQEWRTQNRAIRTEANLCLENIGKEVGVKPAIVYADPPYTDDQYSRYYHVYETLVRYDYPDALGRGRYRQDREISRFSLKASVLQAITTLIEKSAMLEADLVLSYPTNGLLKHSRTVIPEIIHKTYGKSPDVKEICHVHSTMGSSKGKGRHNVTEVIYAVQH